MSHEVGSNYIISFDLAQVKSGKGYYFNKFIDLLNINLEKFYCIIKFTPSFTKIHLMHYLIQESLGFEFRGLKAYPTDSIILARMTQFFNFQLQPSNTKYHTPKK